MIPGDLKLAVENEALAPFVCNYPPRSAYVSVESPPNLDKLWRQDLEISGVDLNLYIHIPFCGYKCGFCNLYTAICTDEDMHFAYAQAIIHQITAYAKIISARRIRTVYVGGGTPTLLKAPHLSKILEALDDVHPTWRSQVEEIAIEASPDSIGTREGEEYLMQLASYGFDRVNIGVQSLVSQELRNAGRARAGAEKAALAIEAARRAGISNISTDLIIGFHDQTDESWFDSVSGLLEQRPDTISTYFLTLRPDAWFSRTSRYSSELSRGIYRRYDAARKLFQMAGYTQETNVRFCLPGSGGYRQKSLYFGGVPVLGIGAGARSYSNVADYVIGGGDHPSLSQIQDYVSKSMSEELRPRAGFVFTNEERVRRQFALNLFDLDLSSLEKFDVASLTHIYEPIISEAMRLDLVHQVGTARYCLTNKGLRHRDVLSWCFFSEVVKARDHGFYERLAQPPGPATGT